MAARLARVKATVVAGEHGELRGVSITVRDNIATVRLGEEVLLSAPGVTGVVPVGRRSWELRFEIGESWTITDEKRKCCGQR